MEPIAGTAFGAAGGWARRLAAIAGLLACVGCPTRHTRPTDGPQSPDEIIAAIRRGSRTVRTVTGMLGLEVWRGGERVRLRQLIIVEQPDRIRVDTLSPFDQPISMMASDGQTIRIFSMEKKRFWRGSASPRNLARLLPVELESKEMAALLRGQTPLIAAERTELGWDADAGLYTIELFGTQRRQVVALEPTSLRVVEFRVWRAGELEYAARFGDYAIVGTGTIPKRLRIEVPAERLTIDIRVKDVSVNHDVDPGAFQIDPPRGIEVEALE